MKIAIFDAKEYDEIFFKQENNGRHEITFIKENLSMDTIEMVKGFDAVSGFVNTSGEEAILKAISELGVKFWLQRSMGYNRVDLKAAQALGMNVWRVPNYSAETVAEHAVTLMMAANRRIVKAYDRVKEGNFSLNGLQGKAVHGSVVGVIGAGKIGQGFIKTVKGMGANVLVFDEFAQERFPQTATDLGFEYVTLDEMLSKSDFISLHAPLLPSTEHIINKETISKMKPGVILINAARGGLVDTTALVEGLKSGQIAGAGIDVIEREEGRAFFDLSDKVEELKSSDPEWKYLMESDDVILTAHQAFFSTLALTQIAQITLANADDAAKGEFGTSLQLQEDGRVLNG